MKTHAGSTTCARNLPQHFNGCTCTSHGTVTAEVDMDLTSCTPCDEVPGECNGCNGTGEYYAKRCTVCGGSGRTTSAEAMVEGVLSGLPSRGPDFQGSHRSTSIAEERAAREKRIASDCAWMVGLDDARFAEMLDNRLQMFEMHRAYDVRDIHMDQEFAEALRDELRVRKGAEVPGMPGAEDRIDLYAKASTHLFAVTKIDPGVPQDADEAIGYLRRTGSWYGSESKDEADAAVLSFAQADPKVAQAYINAHDAKVGEINYFDGNSRPWREKREQAVMALGVSENPDVRVIAAKNAQFVSPVVDVLAADPEAEVRRAIAARYGRIIEMRSVRPQSSSRAWDIDLDQHERALIHDSAFKRDKQGRATVKMLEALTVDPDTDVRRECAKSQVFPSKKALKNLATDRDPMVRRLLVDGIERKVVNDDVIEILARDPEDGIREALVASGVPLTDKAKRSIAQAKTNTGPAISQPKEYAVVDGKIVQQVARRKK
jgi:hypothetical protein